MRWRAGFLALLIALQPVLAAPTLLDRAIADLARGDGTAAEQDIINARRAGVADAATHHLLAHAYLLQGDAARALREADAAGIPAPFALYAAKIRIKADLARGDVTAAGSEINAALATHPNDDVLWTELTRARAFVGDLGGAMATAQRATQLNPRSAEALLLVASLTRDQQGLGAAVPLFNQALQIDPHNVPALLERAATLGELGQAHAMLDDTRRALAIQPNNAQAFYLQAVLAARAGNYDLARALLYKCTPALDHLPGQMLLRGIVDAQLGDTEQAISQLRLLLDVRPNNFTVRRLLGHLFSIDNDPEAAIDVLKPLADRPDADSYALLTIARAYEDTDNRAAAAPYLDRAAIPAAGQATPFEPDIPLNLLARNDSAAPTSAENTVPFIQGLILAGNTAFAVDRAQALATLNPGVPLAHVILGDAQLAKGDMPAAIAAYQRAVALAPTEPTLLRLINAYQRAHDNPHAIGALQLYLKTNPNNIEALRLLASLDIAETQWRAAIVVLERLRARLGNHDAQLLNELAICWSNAGDAPRALVYARAAYALQPANPILAQSYGWQMFQSGTQQADGIALLEKAVNMAPDHPALRLELAQAYFAQGRVATARHVLGPLAARTDLDESRLARALLKQP